MYKGTIGALGGKGGAIHFQTDDIESYNIITDILKVRDSQEKKIKRLENELQQKTFEQHVTESKARSLTGNVLQSKEALENRIIFLEIKLKQFVERWLSVYPISLTTSKEGDANPPMDLEYLGMKVLEEARIKLAPGEKIGPKRYSITSGSF